MKANKIAFYISLIISIITLALSIVFQSCNCNSDNCGYLTNLFISTFAGALLVLIVSLINYFSIRRETLERFFDSVMRFAKLINSYNATGGLEYKTDFFLDMYRYDFDELDKSFSGISFIKDKKNRKYIYNDIYTPIKRVRDKINQNYNHLVQYKNAANGNEDVAKKTIEEIESTFLEKGTWTPTDGSTRVACSFLENELAVYLFNELSGNYYRIMYFKTLEDDKKKYLDNNK